MKKIMLSISVAMMMFSCQNGTQLETDKQLSDQIESEFRNHSSDIIRLYELNDFDWDSMVILKPYTKIDEVETDLKIDLENLKGDNIEFSDSYYLIVFLNNGKATKIAQFSANVGFYNEASEIIKKEDAEFLLSNDKEIRLL